MDKCLLSLAGRHFRYAHPPLGQGGQGTVFRAWQAADPTNKAVIKQMPFSTVTQTRLQFWVNHHHGYRIPGLAAPLAYADADPLSYLAVLADGHAIEVDPPRTLPALLESAILMVGVWVRLEQLGIAHGDIAPSNILVTEDGDITLIDVDNYVAPNIHAPTMYGQHAFMAPELRHARNDQRQNITPSVESDRFSWAVLLNFWLLGRHPVDGGETVTPAGFDQKMSTGIWPELQRTLLAGEMPIEVLGMLVNALFNRAFSCDPSQRPSAEEWYRGLWHALERLFIHQCGGGMVIDASSSHCPWCGENIDQIPHQITLKLTGHALRELYSVILKMGQSVTLGRCCLPRLSEYVSEQHVEMSYGATGLTIRHCGTNPTCLYDHHQRKYGVHDIFYMAWDQCFGGPWLLCIADEVLMLEII